MTKMKYQGIAKTIFCLSMLLNAGSANADPLDLEGPNLIGPRKPSRPKLDWEDKKPQGQISRGKNKRMDYFKKHPDLLDQASKNLSGNGKSIIIQRDIDGNIIFDDPRS